MFDNLKVGLNSATQSDAAEARARFSARSMAPNLGVLVHATLQAFWRQASCSNDGVPVVARKRDG